MKKQLLIIVALGISACTPLRKDYVSTKFLFNVVYNGGTYPVFETTTESYVSDTGELTPDDLAKGPDYTTVEYSVNINGTGYPCDVSSSCESVVAQYAPKELAKNVLSGKPTPNPPPLKTIEPNGENGGGDTGGGGMGY